MHYFPLKPRWHSSLPVLQAPLEASPLTAKPQPRLTAEQELFMDAHSCFLGCCLVASRVLAVSRPGAASAYSVKEAGPRQQCSRHSLPVLSHRDQQSPSCLQECCCPNATSKALLLSSSCCFAAFILKKRQWESSSCPRGGGEQHFPF